MEQNHCEEEELFEYETSEFSWNDNSKNQEEEDDEDIEEPDKEWEAYISSNRRVQEDNSNLSDYE